MPFKSRISAALRDWVNRRELRLVNAHNVLQFSRLQKKPEQIPYTRGRIQIVCPDGWGTCEIGSGVLINSGIEFNPVGGDCTVFSFLQPNAKLVIGNSTGISNSRIAVVECVEIGAEVNIGAGCCIYDSDFHSLNLENRKQGNTGVAVRPVKVERGAFLGAFTTVLKGVTIGEESVIGARSVVTKSVPAREVWAGNPARFVRRNDATAKTDRKWI